MRDHLMFKTTSKYSEISEKKTIWEEYTCIIHLFCPLLRGCPLEEMLNVLFLI